MKPTYNIDLSYDDNYLHGPDFQGETPGQEEINVGLDYVKFLGKTLHSTLGVPAGPLLNSAYIKLYAELGFDVLTYKTVRTRAHPSHSFPNVRFVNPVRDWYREPGPEKPLLITLGGETANPAEISITNSFGMPSRSPEVWQEDVARAKAGLNPGQMLVVSVVGTVKPGQTMEELGADYALAAGLADEAGADAIEANLSCPNVCSGEGSLYQDPAAVGIISRALKDRLATRPFLLKLGYLSSESLVREVVQAANQAGCAGLAAINTIPARVMTPEMQQALPGEGRLVSGICGAGIKGAGLDMISRLATAREALKINPVEFVLVGVGGVMTGQDALEYLQIGADGVQSGTGAMWNPYLAREFKAALRQSLQKIGV